jgi:hypothetical protein
VQTRFQLTSIARNRRAVVLSLVFPVVLLVMFDSIFVSGSDSVELAGAKVTAQAYFTGWMLAYAIMHSGSASWRSGSSTSARADSSSACAGRRCRLGRSSPRPCSGRWGPSA